MRQEKDLLGSITIQESAPHGAQTERTIQIYPTDHAKKMGDFPLFIETILMIKKACAITNKNICELDPSYEKAIICVIEQLLNNIHTTQKLFPIHAYHGGGGIAINMSINEVIANLANRDYFQSNFGHYNPIHPNDHINLNNSTSDVVKTAIHITVIREYKSLKESIDKLTTKMNQFIEQYGDQKKISRTCLQDAIAITFGNLFSGYLVAILRHQKIIEHDIEMLHAINLGGNMIGRQGDTSLLFFDQIIETLREVTTIKSLTRVDNLFDASQNNDLLVRFANDLSQLASTLIRIAKDLRLMASGPETGLHEVTLPIVQQGSSAMPGKINPNIPEYMIQTAFQVIGICHSITITQMHDELDYSPWQTFIATQLFEAINLMSDAITVFAEKCIDGIMPDHIKNQNNIETIIPTMVQLAKERGYFEALKIYKANQDNLDDIKQFLQPR